MNRTNIIIGDQIVEWAPPINIGDDVAPYAAMLTEIYIFRTTMRARYFASKNPNATREEIQSEIYRICSSFVFDDEMTPDAIELEAIEIAEETIRAKLAAANLPPPRSLRDHAMQLINDPRILDQAKVRVLARIAAAKEILAGVPT
jgi:hypothetical protein